VPENDSAVHGNFLAWFFGSAKGEQHMEQIEAPIDKQAENNSRHHEPMGFRVPFFKKNRAGAVKHDARVGAVFG
jgi:hypothetical protein